MVLNHHGRLPFFSRCAAELTTPFKEDIQNCEGASHLRAFGKFSKNRCYAPFYQTAQHLLEEYLELADRSENRGFLLFQTLSNSRDEDNPAPLPQSSTYRDVIKKLSLVPKLDVSEVSNRAMRATAATNALSKSVDIAKVLERLCLASASTTKLYDRRQTNDSPAFWVNHQEISSPYPLNTSEPG